MLRKKKSKKLDFSENWSNPEKLGGCRAVGQEVSEVVLDVKKVDFSENSYLRLGWSGVGWGWIWLSLGGFRVILGAFALYS